MISTQSSRKNYKMLFLYHVCRYRAPSNRSQNETSSNTNTASSGEDNRSSQSHRSNRFVGQLNRLSHSRNGGSWYRPVVYNPPIAADPTPASNPSTVFVPQDASRPAANIEQPQAPISPDILMYGPYPNGQNSSNAEASNIRNGTQATDPATFPAQNGTTNGTPGQSQPQARHGSRCPFYRRVSMSGYHNAPNYYHSNLQNGNNYFRPAYAPHESLWFRQQSQQELHRRHMTNPTNENTTSSSFGTYPNRGTASMSNNNVCAQCDQQHPIGHPHHRRVRQYVCGLNLVCICIDNLNYLGEKLTT